MRHGKNELIEFLDLLKFHYGDQGEPTVFFPGHITVQERRLQPRPYHMNKENSYKFHLDIQITLTAWPTPNGHNDPGYMITKLADTDNQK